MRDVVSILVVTVAVSLLNLISCNSITSASVQKTPIQPPIVNSKKNMGQHYPKVIIENKSAEARINTDISRYIQILRDYVKGDSNKIAEMFYEVKYEDDSVISLVLDLEMGYKMAAHPSPHHYGLVYDKVTGERIPLYNYLKINISDLKSMIPNHTYNVRDKALKVSYETVKRINYVPENYFLMGEGIVCPLFQTYELGAYSDMYTYIRFDKDMVELYNNKNR